MTMPVMNGWLFPRRAGERTPLSRPSPSIVFTADHRAEENARSIGAAGWLRKPIDPERLLEVVGKYCSRASRPSSAA